MKRLLAVTLLIVLTSGCNSTVARKSVLMPANSKGMQGAKNIAVVSVKRTGSHSHGTGGNISNKIEAFLTNINVRGKVHFNVVDRETTKKIVKEQQLSSNQSFDQATAARLGRLVGADTLLTAIYQIEDDDSYYDEQRSTCIKERASNGKLKKALGMSSCEKYQTSSVRCHKRGISVEFTPKVTSVVTGKIVFAKTYTARAESSHCPDKSYGELKPADTLVRESLDGIFSQMRRDVAPYSVMLDLQLIKKDKTQMPQASKALFEEGMFFAEEGLFNRACNKFVESATIYNASPAIMYNLGVCQELKGNGEAALGYYDKALALSVSLSTGNKKLVVKAIKRQEGQSEAQQKPKSRLEKALDMVQGISDSVLR